MREKAVAASKRGAPRHRGSTTEDKLPNYLNPPVTHLVLIPAGGPIINQLLDAADFKPKLAKFSLQLIQPGTLFANVLVNSRWRMPLGRKFSCGKPFRMLV